MPHEIEVNMTVADSLRVAVRALAGHSDSPRLDAELLLCQILGLSRAGLVVRGTEPLAVENQQAYQNLIARRAHGAPIAYLTGTREFWSLQLTVTPDVLVPRPETEVLVEQALALLPECGQRAVLDLGTGSGAIALAIAAERPQARIIGIEISDGALAVAMSNSRRLGLSRIDWRLGSWFEAVAGKRFDVIVANPPYVSSDDPALRSLAAEPALALTPGPTGLEALTAIIGSAAGYLNPQGWLLLEHGSDQADDVARLLECHGFGGIRRVVDTSDRPRVTLGTILSSHPSSH